MLHRIGAAGGIAAVAGAMQSMGWFGVANAAPLAQMPGDLGNRRSVVVLGAGFAGLVAAYELEQRGFSVTVLEARGLDATPQIQTKLRRIGTPDALAAVALLDIILRDEVGHVEIGNRWYRWLCAGQGLDPVTHYGELVQRHQAPPLRPPFNQEARLRAGFSQQEIDYLLGA